MDIDNALPPPIRRSPRAALENQELQSLEYDSNENKNGIFSSLQHTLSPESATPPNASSPIVNFSRQRLLNSSNHNIPSISAEDPLYSRSVAPPLPRRSPARLKSFHRRKRYPTHLQKRRPSLETIQSVMTTQSHSSEDELEADPPEVAAPSPERFIPLDDSQEIRASTERYSYASSACSSVSSKRSSDPQTTTSVNQQGTVPLSPKTIFTKMKPFKSTSSDNLPDRLIIERTVSINRSSHPSTMPPFDRSCPPEALQSNLYEDERRPSVSSSEWSASSFDTTSLTEAELMKCKKKGINPSLYAEMKAARKGKWTSPIAGNSFL